MSGRAARPDVVIGRVHAEPESQPPTSADPTRAPADVAWLAVFEDGTIERYASADALVRRMTFTPPTARHAVIELR